MNGESHDPVGSLLARVAVVLQTDRLVVIDKPSGLLSVPGRGEANRRSAASWCRERFPQATGPITVHRLDMDTSGLLLMALDAEAQRALSAQFEARTVEKAYEAIVAGEVHGDTGTVTLPLRLDLENRPRQLVDFEQGKAARTDWRVIGREHGRTRLALVPHTGRSHQIRLHCAHRGAGGLGGGGGHPVLGDVLYGDSHAAERLLLHATRLVFDDPTTGERTTCECPAPF